MPFDLLHAFAGNLLVLCIFGQDWEIPTDGIFAWRNHVEFAKIGHTCQCQPVSAMICRLVHHYSWFSKCFWVIPLQSPGPSVGHLQAARDTGECVFSLHVLLLHVSRGKHGIWCVCVCLSPPRRFQFCVGLFSLSQLVYFFVVSEFVSMDIFNLMVRIYLIATICLSCFCRLLFHSYICLTLTIHTVSYLFYQPKSLLHPRHCRLISACLSRCIYSDFFLADILLSVVSPPTRIFSRLPYIFW